MQNYKIGAYILASISILFALWFVWDELVNLSDSSTLSLMVGISAIASGVSGVIMSLASKRTAIFEAVREYYQQGDTAEMIACRHKVYAAENGETELDKKAASEICSFFNFWGMMVRRGFLPMWVFASASGPSVVRLYEILEPYILERRDTNNQLYAMEFEVLVKRIRRKYGMRVKKKVLSEESNSNQVQQ